MNAKRILALSALALTPACGGNGGGGSARENGGAILVFGEPEGVVVSAVLYSDASAAFPEVPVAGDACTVTPSTTGEFNVINVVDLNLGPAVTLTDGATPLTTPVGDDGYAGVLVARHAFAGADMLDIVHSGPAYEYRGGFLVPQPFGATWTLTNAGAIGRGLEASTLGSFSIPGQITQDPEFESPSSVTPGTSASVRWTGGEGAQFVHVYAVGDLGSADCYVDGTQKSFVLSADVTAALGDGAYAQVSAENISYVRIAGRDVLVVSGADNLD